MSRLRLLVPALLSVTACATTPRVELTTRVYPADAVTVHGDEVWRAYRAIDGLSGAPIAGAELLLVEERDFPIRGEMWYRHRAVADADGFVRIRDEGEKDWSWLVLRAPGYSPAMEMNAFDGPVVSLAPAQDVPVLVLDEQDQPVVGALVGFCSGCGHTPDLVDATTDANGIAVLRGVDVFNGIADLYLEHPDCDLGYESVRWYPGDPPSRILPGPGVPIEGVVVDVDGAPVSGVPVGVHDFDRGPWTRTATDGSFRLCGLSEPHDLHVELNGRQVRFEHPPQMPYRLQLPDPDGRDVQVVNLPPTAAGLDGGTHDEVPLATESLPRVLVCVDAADGDVQVVMHTQGDAVGITDDVREGRPIGVDDRHPVTFELWSHGSRRLVRFASGEAVRQPALHLRWYEPTRLLARLVDASGELVPARAALVRVDGDIEGFDLRELQSLEPTDGRLDLAGDAVGLALLAVLPDDTGLAPRLIPVSFPDRGDGQSLELGDVVLSATAQLTVAGEASATFLRKGWPLRLDPPSFPIDERGRWLGPDPHAGDAIEVPGSEDEQIVDLPCRTLLAGDGPWMLRPPAGTLQIDVRDSEGEPLDSLVFVGDQIVEVYGPTTLRRVPTGPQRLFVATEDHLSGVVELDVRESGTEPLAITLPTR